MLFPGFVVFAYFDDELLCFRSQIAVGTAFEHVFRQLEGLANGHLFAEQQLIKRLSEGDRRLVHDLVALLHANDVFDTCVVEDVTGEL